MSEAPCLTPGSGVVRQPGGYYIPPPPGATPLPAFQPTASISRAAEEALDELRRYLSLPVGAVPETGRRELIRMLEDDAAMAEAWLASRQRTAVPD